MFKLQQTNDSASYFLAPSPSLTFQQVEIKLLQGRLALKLETGYLFLDTVCDETLSLVFNLNKS
jgi:hypothetical protein